MKRIIVSVIIICAIFAVAYLVLLRPTDISQDNLTTLYNENQADFNTVAQYLVKNDVSTEITGFISADNNYGVPKTSESDYRNFNLAVENVISKACFDRIISDGQTVEFVYDDEGGLLNRLDCSIIYNGKDEVAGKTTVALNNDGWHLYISEN